jgi:hypothetical protein
MANMSYCRFENTLRDLNDCYHNMTDKLDGSELDARRNLIELCILIAQEYGETNEDGGLTGDARPEADYEEDE